MTTMPEAHICVRVDPTNPGQFFACCGLLELADRLWGGAEGWFHHDGGTFYLRSMNPGQHSFVGLIDDVHRTGLLGELSPRLKTEREVLETRKRQLKKEMKTLSQEDETRRKELGALLRAGSIVIGKPFDLRLDWWDDDSADVPKTWAGSQEVLRIARAALASSTEAFATDSPFKYVCVMRAPSGESAEAEEEEEGEERDEAAGDKVEPFYFDARRGAHAHPLDIGFSPNKLKHLTLAASPATEFLCLVGLQRHRPKPTSKARVFEYCTWAAPLTSAVAQAAVSGLLPHVDARIFTFENAFRTDQRKHKGFIPATSTRRRE